MGRARLTLVAVCRSSRGIFVCLRMRARLTHCSMVYLAGPLCAIAACAHAGWQAEILLRLPGCSSADTAMSVFVVRDMRVWWCLGEK
jgi:hypothetical protein